MPSKTISIKNAKKYIGRVEDGRKNTVAKIEHARAAPIRREHRARGRIEQKQGFAALLGGVAEGELYVKVMVARADATEKIALVFLREIDGKPRGAV